MTRSIHVVGAMVVLTALAVPAEAQPALGYVLLPVVEWPGADAGRLPCVEGPGDFAVVLKLVPGATLATATVNESALFQGPGLPKFSLEASNQRDSGVDWKWFAVSAPGRHCAELTIQGEGTLGIYRMRPFQIGAEGHR